MGLCQSMFNNQIAPCCVLYLMNHLVLKTKFQSTPHIIYHAILPQIRRPVVRTQGLPIEGLFASQGKRILAVHKQIIYLRTL